MYGNVAEKIYLFPIKIQISDVIVCSMALRFTSKNKAMYKNRQGILDAFQKVKHGAPCFAQLEGIGHGCICICICVCYTCNQAFTVILKEFVENSRSFHGPSLFNTRSQFPS